ncbi:MAG: coenzyme F420-0:L-glutamate ligase [Candidatus Magasanikbacteria bacterium]|nr:coenzyme F420-0:L-glutamate ligase [Candidatus Magasanikbacteria bacterium]
MIVTPIKTSVVHVNDDLIAHITKHIPTIADGSILVVTSKIVAFAEGRWVPKASARLKAKLVREESEWSMKTKYCWLSIKDGAILGSAGIDESNAHGGLVLLPKDSYESAKKIRDALRAYYGVKKLGVIITDSRLLPLRAGVVGIALGYAGFSGIREYRGSQDLNGRVMSYSRTDVADSLATAAVVVMGEGDECQPLAMIVDAPVEWVEEVDRKELYIDPREDVYAPLWRRVRSWGKVIGPRTKYSKRKKIGGNHE